MREPNDERVLILAPRGRDAAVVAGLVAAEHHSDVCNDLACLLTFLSDGAGCAVVTEEALDGQDLTGLVQYLRGQEPWSDFPFIVLATQRTGRRSEAAQSVLADLANVIILERPINPDTLVRAVGSALRARRRQYVARDHLMERRQSQIALSELNDTLEQRIHERTLELARANDRLVAEIAEKERAQASLVQSQKMEAVGQLTGGIAHDFNNLLTVIVGNIDMIARRTDDDKIRRLAEYARQASERATYLTGQLLAFSRSQSLKLEPVEVDALLRNASDLLIRTIGPSIEVSLDLEAEGLYAVADGNQLELAVLNTAINARDAMPDGGRLTIRTFLSREPPPGLAEDAYVVIAISDTGTGMPPDILAKVFDPFFTTKPVGHGTGLGLSQVYGIAQQSGGTARIESVLGKGTTVEIWLAQTLTAAAPKAGETTAALTMGDRELILVVDDDDDVRRFLSECLESLGYRTIEAPDGAAGLEAVRRSKPDLVIVDFAMPGMSGADMIARARRTWSDLPIMMATGYADMDAVQEVIGSELVLRKPFHVAELAAAVRAALAGAQVAALS